MQDEMCPGLPVMALTATATSKVMDDVIKSLKIPRSRRFQVHQCFSCVTGLSLTIICDVTWHFASWHLRIVHA